MSAWSRIAAWATTVFLVAPVAGGSAIVRAAARREAETDRHGTVFSKPPRARRMVGKARHAGHGVKASRCRVRCARYPAQHKESQRSAGNEKAPPELGKFLIPCRKGPAQRSRDYASSRCETFSRGL